MLVTPCATGTDEVGHRMDINRCCGAFTFCVLADLLKEVTHAFTFILLETKRQVHILITDIMLQFQITAPTIARAEGRYGRAAADLWLQQRPLLASNCLNCRVTASHGLHIFAEAHTQSIQCTLTATATTSRQ